MNTKRTIYSTSPTTTPGIASMGLYGNGEYPIFRKPVRFEGDGLAISTIKTVAKSALAKSKTAVSKRALKKKGQSAMKSKIQTALNKKFQTAVKRLTGSKTLSKNVKSIINNKIKTLGPTVTQKLVASSPRGIESHVRKVIGKSSIKEPSHNDLVRQAERMIYSGANF